MIGLDEYEALIETAHLLRSPVNAKTLLGSVSEADAGKLVEHNPAPSKRR
jgi:antitoxin YefM